MTKALAHFPEDVFEEFRSEDNDRLVLAHGNLEHGHFELGLEELLKVAVGDESRELV